MGPEIKRHNWHSFLSFWAIFCPLTPLTTRKIKILKKKIEKALGDIVTLNLCTTNDNHMMCGSWDMKCDRQIFLSFWTIFCTFTLLTTQKIKMFKIWRNASRYYRYTHKRTINEDHKCMVPKGTKTKFFSHFRTFFALLPL